MKYESSGAVEPKRPTRGRPTRAEVDVRRQMLADRRNRQAFCAASLAARVAALAEARSQMDRPAMRQALIDIAACATAWADGLPAPMEP